MRLVGCLIAILAVFTPRVALVIVWIFTPYVSRAFNHVFIWPFLGLLILPFTTLIYSLVYAPGTGVHGASWVWVGIGVFLDIAWHGGSARKASRRD